MGNDVPPWPPENLGDLTELEKLRAIERWGDRIPWTPRHELLLRATGGAHLRDDKRVTVASGTYAAFVEGNRRAEISNEKSLEVHFNYMSDIIESDNLTVNGSANVEAHERIIIGGGDVSRTWTGAALRMIGMEGVIAGGLFTKNFLGSNLTVSPLATGDVYGGGLQGAALRVRMAGKFGYQSAERAMFNGGLLNRASTITIEPMVGSPTTSAPRHWLLKLGRIGLGMFPPGDILFGLVVMMPLSAAAAIYGIAKNWKKPPAPPAGPPRVHNRTYGTKVEGRASDKNL